MSGASPFDLDDRAAYERWRAHKLSRAPRRLDDILVEVGDPRALSEPERHALLARCANANMAIYASARSEDDKAIPRRLAAQLGLTRLDGNFLADDDGITPLEVAARGERSAFIPYTDRAIRWHTDGYYNPHERKVRGMLLHCVRSAAEGGGNALLDHEIAYILLRDESPGFIAALMAPDAMTIPARADEDGVARAAQAGPVFSVDADGSLHMRYTARTRSIVWKDDAPTRAAVACLERLLGGDTPYILRTRLEPGMGLVCNNVLHDRAAFSDAPGTRRLLYRARYYERVARP